MIKAVNNFTEGNIFKIYQGNPRYMGLDIVDKSLKLLIDKVSTNVLSEVVGSSSNIKPIISETLYSKVFNNKNFLQEFFYNKVEINSTDIINFYMYLKGEYAIKDSLINLLSSNILFYEVTNLYDKRQFVRTDDYLFYRHINMEKFVLLGKFQVDIEKVISNNTYNITSNNVVCFSNTFDSPKCFLPTKHFFNKKQHNLRYLKDMLIESKIKLVKDCIVEYEVVTPKIDEIKSIPKKLELLELVKERASRNTFSSNENLVLC